MAWADKTTTEGALALAFGYMDGVNANGIGHAWVWVICNGIPLFYEGQTGRPMAKPPLSMNDAEA